MPEQILNVIFLDFGLRSFVFRYVHDPETFCYFVAIGFVQAIVALYGGHLAVMGLHNVSKLAQWRHRGVFIVTAVAIGLLTIAIGKINDKTQYEASLKAKHAEMAETDNHNLLLGISVTSRHSSDLLAPLQSALDKGPINSNSAKLLADVYSVRKGLAASALSASNGAVTTVVNPPASLIAATKKSLDLLGMRVSRIGSSMPDKRQDLRHSLIRDEDTIKFQHISADQVKQNREEYLRGLDALDLQDANTYRALAKEIAPVLSDAFVILNYSESLKAAEMDKFRELGKRAVTETNRSEKSSPHLDDYQAIQFYLGSIASQL
ncbi:hypothetical protein BH10ACI4_BH10ACI4_16930 [soil metagenome]